MNLKKFEEFIIEFDYLLLDEHREEFLRYIAFLKPYFNMEQVKSKYGTHYISCPWSKDNTTSGPDTCECCDTPRIVKKLEKLMHFYYRIRNKKCRDCILKKCFI